MVYSVSITTVKNTSEVNAIRTVLRVGKGLVWRIEAEFPPGCAGLAHLKIMDGGYQVFPASLGQSFASDGTVVSFDDLYLKNSAPYQFDVLTWNVDTHYSHTIQVRIGLASSEAFMSRYMPSLSWEKFNQSMKDAAKIQQAEKDRQLEDLANQLGG